MLDAIRFDHTAFLSFRTGEDGPFGTGYGYAVDGDATTVRWASYREFDEDAKTGPADEIVASDDVSVDTDGDLVVLEATADTDRLALDGSVIERLRMPFE
jgi:hypothetical protein